MRAYVLAERLRGKIRENFAADLFPLTISFGVASYPTHGADHGVAAQGGGPGALHGEGVRP